MFRRFAALYVIIFLTAPVIMARPQPGAQSLVTPAARTPSLTEVLAKIDELLEDAREANEQGHQNDAMLRLNEAQQLLEKVRAAAPRNLQATVQAAEMATMQGMKNEARMLFKEVLEVEPSNFRANLGLGRFYVSTRLYRQARVYLEEADKVAPSDHHEEVLRWLAAAYAGQGQLPDAIDTLKRAVEIEPDSFEALSMLVNMQMQAGSHEQALESAEDFVTAAQKSYDAAPAETWFLRRLVMAYETQIEALKAHHNGLHTQDVHAQFTEQLLPGKEAEAANVLSRIAHVSERLATLRWELSYHDSLMLMERAVQYQPDNIRYLLDLAGLLLATHQTQRAIETCQDLLEITNPPNTNPADVREIHEAAKELLRRLNAPSTTQPTEMAKPPQ